ncbi:class I SAM-dependent methyltransferase [Spirillospora albida]|uniref:class I SAM-dependent methyltransferase n=1 Tax=Spirillospora albida TaxID=58123 RepID=UPI00055C4BC3|nr:class I SAM-dependent methyltransferase [Spirillospora albida]
MSHPFHGDGARTLYTSEDRTRQRSEALLSAKTSGRNISEVICGFADSVRLPERPSILDVGCGQGRTTVRLARHYPDASLTAVDASPAMVAATVKRTAGLNVEALTGDFHSLPFGDSSFDLAIAIMCLYHSPTPHLAISEIGRTLRASAILVTKAIDSYSELAALLEVTGLDPRATSRPSLYEAAHSGNLPELTEQGGLQVDQVEHETHTFTFNDLMHTATYLATCPQFVLPDHVRQPQILAAELRSRIPDGPITTSATITYVLARPTGRTP